MQSVFMIRNLSSSLALHSLDFYYALKLSDFRTCSQWVYTLNSPKLVQYLTLAVSYHHRITPIDLFASPSNILIPLCYLNLGPHSFPFHTLICSAPAPLNSYLSSYLHEFMPLSAANYDLRVLSVTKVRRALFLCYYLFK